MRKTWKNFILVLIALSLVFQPYIVVFGNNQAKAQDEENTDETVSMTDVAYDGDSTVAQPASLAEFKYNKSITKPAKMVGVDDIATELSRINSDEDRAVGISMEESLSMNFNARLVFNPDDRQAIINLYRLSASQYMPDFEVEPAAMFQIIDSIKAKLSPEQRALVNVTTEADLLNLKVENPALFQELVHKAQLVFAEKYSQDDAKRNIMNDPLAIRDFTGRGVDEINEIINGYRQTTDVDKRAEYGPKYKDLEADIDAAIESIKIDIRVLKLLVYLVTPKTQDGAGHWRIKIKRILSGYTSPNRQLSRESETYYDDLNTNSEEVNTENNTTAADWGRSRPADDTTTTGSTEPVSFDLPETEPFAVVSDENGESYNAFVNFAKAADANGDDEEYEKNLSAHADGQAVDIAEVDDIRCTLIKKKRIGRDSKSKLSQRPIKLAWQTAKGYSEDADANQAQDVAEMLRNMASEGIVDLINEFGGEISDYDRDLSSASFSDIATMLGQSIFTQIINSPGGNLSGYNIGDTLKQIGQMYFADYLGLPRDLFLNHNYDSYQDVEIAIGAAAVEKRLNLPIGTFGGTDLNDMLRRIGQRRIEYEMNLDTGDLNAYFSNSSGVINAKDKNYAIGRAVMEKDLNLKKGSLGSTDNSALRSFADIKNAIGKYKADFTFRDGNYVDSALHLEPGTTENLKKGAMSPYDYISEIGRIRLNDSAWGFQYLASKDASFEVPAGTFERIINGEGDALIDLGITIISRTFAETELERQALAQWVRTNKDSDQCVIEDPITVVMNAGTEEAEEVTISERKAISAGLYSGDLFNLLGCQRSNADGVFQKVGSKIIYTTIIQQYLNSEEKVKFNLTETNPSFSSSDSEKQFYVSRAYKLVDLRDRIKNNWAQNGADPQYIVVKRAVDDIIDRINSIINDSMPILTIDQAKMVARSIAVDINKLNSDIRALQAGANRYVNKINGTIFDISELVRTVAEIIQGKAISSTDNFTLNQIPSFALDLGSATSAVTLNSGRRLNTLAPARSTLMLLFSRKMDPVDFFVKIAAGRIEEELELPQNSLVYFVNNYEKKGLGTVESFYTAVGQAKIENTFNLPSNYFQGPLLSDYILEMPDFRNDLRALYLYGDADIEALAPRVSYGGGQYLQKQHQLVEGASAALDDITLDPSGITRGNLFEVEQLDFSQYFNTDGTVKTGLSEAAMREVDEIVKEEYYVSSLSWVKISDPSTFNTLVARAERRYRDQFDHFLSTLSVTNKDLEVNVDDVVTNVGLQKLNDRLRSPDQDVLFRLGLTGSIEALKNNGSVAWAGADQRAKEIDRQLGLDPGTTRSFITGRTISGNYAKNRLSQQEKQLLSARMKITPAALEKFLQVLNMEIPVDKLSEPAIDIVNIGDNPYVQPTGSADDCQISFDNSGGSLSSSIFISEGYMYFDADTTADNVHIFGSRETAEEYARSHKDRAVDYWSEIAFGLSMLIGGDKNQIASELKNYVNSDASASFLNLDDAAYENIFKNTGISKELLEKIQKGQAADYLRPLVSYKKTVGRKTVNATINAKLFGKLGFRVDTDMFTGNEFFEILSGNFRPLWGIAGNILDGHLGLPSGSVYAILTAPSSRLRECAIAEAGGSILGRFIGLDYVSLRGNIYENIGRANLEKILGLPRNSFAGESLDKAMNNVGAINFVLAFRYPLYDINVDEALPYFYDAQYAKSISSYSTEYKLRKIKEYLDYNSTLSLDSARQAAYDRLMEGIKKHVHDVATQIAPEGNWRQNPPVIDRGNQEAIKRFILRLESLDASFALEKGTTANMLSEAKALQYDESTRICSDGDWYAYRCQIGRPFTVKGGTVAVVITPDSYVNKVSQRATTRFATLAVLELFDFDLSDGQKTAIVNLLTYLPIWTRDKTTGYANIYSSLASVFSIHLDHKAGLDEGTIKQLIATPNQAYDILLPQALRRLDSGIGLDPTSSSSLTWIYQRYVNKYASANNLRPEEPKQAECRDEINSYNVERATLNQREASVYDWIGGNYSLESTFFTADDFSESVVPALAEYSNQVEDRPEYMAKVNELAEIKQRRLELDRLENQCKIDNRNGNAAGNITGNIFQNLDWRGVYSAAQDSAAYFLHDLIYKETKFTINMPPEDILRFIRGGDLRYFQAATIAYAANIFTDIAIGSDSLAMPASMRISYDMIKLWYIGDTEAEEYAANAAAYDFLSGGNNQGYEDSRAPNSIGDVYEGSFWGMLGTQQYYIDNPSPGVYRSHPPTPNMDRQSLVQFSNAQTDITYGTYDQSALAALVATAQSGYDRCRNNNLEIYASLDRDGADESAIMGGCAITNEAGECVRTVAQDVEICNGVMARHDEVENVRQAARENVRDRFYKQAHYRMLDGYLWSIDHNVFPGFSYALFEGTAHERNIAIGSYIRTSLKNGELFGHKFSWLKTISDSEDWLRVIAFANELSGDIPADEVLARFTQTKGFDFLAGYIERQSEKALGFHIPIDYAKGIIVGLTTGHWGLRFTKQNHSFTASNGVAYNFETLGGCFARNVKDKFELKVFTWADKQLGWKPGTAKMVYDYGKQIYEQIKTLKLIKQYETLQKLNDTEKLALFDVEHGDVVKYIKEKGGTPQAKQAMKDKIGGLVIALIAQEITKWIMSAFGDEIAKFEEKFGLVPGSTSILISAGVSVGLTAVAQGLGLMSSGAMASAVAAFWVAVAVFVLVNLFGVYKIEVRCSADGYYPVMQSPSSNNVLDADSGLGVWDGKNESVVQQKSVAAAQYKARRLIYDALEMHNNPLYSDIYPSQIMTGREEDVIATNDAVATNICAVLDPNMVSIKGICGGNTRAGVWSNPQTTAYTHIGF